MIRRPPRSTLTDTLFPYPTLFRSLHRAGRDLIDIVAEPALEGGQLQRCVFALMPDEQLRAPAPLALQRRIADLERPGEAAARHRPDVVPVEEIGRAHV